MGSMSDPSVKQHPRVLCKEVAAGDIVWLIEPALGGREIVGVADGPLDHDSVLHLRSLDGQDVYPIHCDPEGTIAVIGRRDDTAAINPGQPKTVTVELGPNEMLVRIPVVREYESGDWEHSQPGYWYATARVLELVDETLDQEHAADMAFEIEGGDPFPDGFTDLTNQMKERFQGRREAAMEAAARAKELRFIAPVGSLAKMLDTFTKDAG